MALCDLNPMCQARTLFEDIPFYTDYSEMYEWNNIDFAVVAATASAHYNIISELLSHGISVVSEKPLACSMAEIEELYRLADENNVTLRVLFHWRFLLEIEWLAENIESFGNINKITAELYDDYASGGHIRSDRIGMTGAWNDCGINALSLIDVILPLDSSVKLTDSVTETDDTCGYPVYALREYSVNDTIPLRIFVDWRGDLRSKIFYIDFENGDQIQIIHRKGSRCQEIELNGKTVVNWVTDDSLADQYRKIFDKIFDDNYKENRELTLRLHKILFMA
jgi:predicted dehydrogenase